MLTGMKMFYASGTEEMRNERNIDYTTMSTVTLPATGGWQRFLWLWGATGSPAYREDCDDGGGAGDDELMGVITFLK
jgi:hypothetical protein